MLLLLGCMHANISTAQIKLRRVSGALIYDQPPFPSCHASTLVEVKPGKWMAAAFGGTHEGNKDVCIWLSVNEKGTWSKPVKMADGIMSDTLRHPCWNPVLFKASTGKLFLFYKVGPSPSTWWGMVMTSTNDGKTWTKAERLPDGILGPIKNKPVELADGTILSPSSSETKDSWKAHMEKSTDHGKTWTLIPVDPQTPFNLIQPSILIHPDKKLQIICRSKENILVQAFSSDNGNSWGTVTKTSLPNPNSGTDAVTLKNGWQVLIYNPTVQGKGGRAKLNVAVSKDGNIWTDAAVLENEETGEFSYPAVVQATDGTIHITYTYNRVNVKYVVMALAN